MSASMTGAQIVLQALADQGVEHIFGYPGGAVLPIYDELFQHDGLKHVLVRHEQGAVHAAEGYARSTGKVGVVLVTSGPGATNAVTGLTDALMDSIPVVCITGQVPTHLIGNDAFQECDTVGITRPCTKHNYLVKDVDQPGAGPARGVLCCALRPARSRRRGHPQGHPVRQGHIHGPVELAAQELPPSERGRSRRCGGRRRADGERQAPGLLYRRRRHQRGPRRERAAARVGEAYGLSHHLDPHGARRLSGLGQAVARHARHARHLRSQQRHARLRRDDLHRRALRRSHHRADRCVFAGLQEDSRRRRSVLDQQERYGRYPDRRRLRPRAQSNAGRLEEEESQDRQAGPKDLVEADRHLARAQLPALQEARRRDHAAIRPSSGCSRSPAARMSTSPPRSASTRCGRPSTSISTSPTAG